MFNVVFGKTKQDPGIEDPPLTETGHVQSQELAEQFTKLDIGCIIAAPTPAHCRRRMRWPTGWACQ